MKLEFINPTFEQTSNLEYLITNGIGGYAASTLSGSNTRRYHGVLVASFSPPTDRKVLVSKIEEEIQSADRHVSISANKYPGAIHPEGYRTLRSFTRLPFPTFSFQDDELILEKRVAMVSGSNTTIVKYRNLGNVKYRLFLNPLFVYRDYHALFSEDSRFDFWSTTEGNRRFVIYPYYQAPAIYFSFSKGNFINEKLWYRNFEYPREQDRGLDFSEDTISLGKLEVDLEVDEEVTLVFSTDPEFHADHSQEFWNAEEQRIGALFNGYPDRDQFYRDLLLAGDQFIVERSSSDGKTIIAGYPWFTDWGRDTMIAMRGLVIAQGKQDLAKSIIRTFLKYLDQGMLPNRFPDHNEALEYNTIDASLWLFVVLHEYLNAFDDLDFIAEVYEDLHKIIKAHIQGTRYGIHMTNHHLLYGGEGLSQLTWMDARIGDYVVTPRHGCPVEINALWYNALKIFGQFESRLQKSVTYEVLSEEVKKSFRNHFLRDGLILDVVIPDTESSNGVNIYEDNSFRPNQIYALSLPFPLIEQAESKAFLKKFEAELWTPLGIRSLAKNHPDFKIKYEGDPWHRDTSYHQGTVWSFLMGEYWLAYLYAWGFNKKSKHEIRRQLEVIKTHFYQAECIHGISEIFDGEEPGEGKGCFHQAWSIGMILLVLQVLEQGKR